MRKGRFLDVQVMQSDRTHVPFGCHVDEEAKPCSFGDRDFLASKKWEPDGIGLFP